MGDVLPKRRIFSGSPFEREFAYARAVVDGDWVFVAGTTGYDYVAMTISDDLVEQCRQTLENISHALADAGCTMGDVVRVHYLVTPGNDFAACAPVLREHFGEHPPAATMMVVGLLDPKMKIEIEVTARRGLQSGAP